MTTTLNTLIENVESELRTVIQDNVIGVTDIFFDDAFPIPVNYPCVHFQLNTATPNNFETNDPPDIEDWNLNYDVACMFAGIEQEVTMASARTFGNDVYDAIRAQRANNEFLSGNCLDIDLESINYVLIELGTRDKIYIAKGALIKLILRVVEER